MQAKVRRLLRNCQRRLQRRLRKKPWQEQRRRLFRDPNIHYEVGDKDHGLHCGGRGAFQLLVRQLGLADAIDRDLHLLKRPVPYFESDHVLNRAYNLRAGGRCLQDLERLRTNETYLDVLGAQRLPAPSTAGDFLRRFADADLDTRMQVFNQKRVPVWQQQPADFRERALIEADGTLVGTPGECKAGRDLSYNGVWGAHPLVVSLANTQEPLFRVNRPASRPRYEGAAAYFDQAAALCRQAGFRPSSFRGDTDFTQAAHGDRWDSEGVHFVLGLDAQPNRVAAARRLPERVWQELPRPPRHGVATEPREHPAHVQQAVVVQKGYQDIRRVSEQVAEFNYRPGACAQDYLIGVLRKNRVLERKGQKIAAEIRYFFYITNEWTWEPAAVVYFANDRCNQEKLIEQLKNGVGALRAPSNTLESNGAYLVIAAWAWSLKAWLALLQPRPAERQALLTMGFKKFLAEVVLLPCQVVRAGRQLLYRRLPWNPWVDLLCRTTEVLRRLRFS